MTARGAAVQRPRSGPACKRRRAGHTVIHRLVDGRDVGQQDVPRLAFRWRAHVQRRAGRSRRSHPSLFFAVISAPRASRYSAIFVAALEAGGEQRRLAADGNPPRPAPAPADTVHDDDVFVGDGRCQGPGVVVVAPIIVAPRGTCRPRTGVGFEIPAAQRIDDLLDVRRHVSAKNPSTSAASIVSAGELGVQIVVGDYSRRAQCQGAGRASFASA